MTGAAVLASGCLLDGSPLNPDGSGGSSSGGSNNGGSSSGGSSAGGSSSGGSSSGGSATTGGSGGTTTSMGDCTSAAECPDAGPCKTAKCDNNTCTYTFATPGTLVKDESSNDCVKIECNATGSEVMAADDDDVPVDMDPTDCKVPECQGMTIGSVDIPDGTACGTQPENPCQESVCASGACEVQNKPDETIWGPDPYPSDCGVTLCYDGSPYFIGGTTPACPDSTPSDCVVDYCAVYSDDPGMCVEDDAPMNTPCKKPNGTNGFCNSFGDCL